MCRPTVITPVRINSAGKTKNDILRIDFRDDKSAYMPGELTVAQRRANTYQEDL
jgi:hypothetical protein